MKYKHQTPYTQRNLFGILLNQTEIRLYVPVSDWFGTKRTPFGAKSIGKWQIQSDFGLITIWFPYTKRNFCFLSNSTSSICFNKFRHFVLVKSELCYLRSKRKISIQLYSVYSIKKDKSISKRVIRNALIYSW